MIAEILITLVVCAAALLIGVFRTTTLASFPAGGSSCDFCVPGEPAAALATIRAAVQARRGWRVTESTDDDLLIITNPSGSNWGMFYRLSARSDNAGTQLRVRLKAKAPARAVQYAKARDDLRRMLKAAFHVAEL